MSAGAPVWKVASVWAARLLTGAVFILSGWAKAVDPRGFVYKIGEYLAVWGIDRLIPYELVILGAVVLSVVELTIGVLLATGCLRRSTPICGLVMMLFMLPLTVYIAVADPVADCGCFGDLLVISNTATMLKNVALTALLVLCLVWHKAARPLYRPGLQWLVIALSCVYGLVLAVIGWQFQPVADFRPYGVGKTLVADDGTSGAERYVYEKNGERREYTLDMLPDSTWTFVERAGGASEATREGLAVFDGDDEVTDELFDPSEKGEMLVLAVVEPGLNNLMRTRMANEIYEYATEHGIAMIGLVAASGDSIDRWVEMARPEYDVYSASDTSLKELVRGATGLVFMRDGHVVWKRNFATISPDLLSRPDPFGSVTVVDDGRVAWWLAGAFVAGMLVLYALSALTRMKLRPKRLWPRKQKEA